MEAEKSPYFRLLKNRINLKDVPFTERGSRLVVFREGEHLVIRLAERWIKRDEKLAAYRSRPPLVNELQFTDEAGTPLALNLTSYPHRLSFRTAAGEYQLAFQDTETILITLPPGTHGLTFLAQVNQAQTDRRGGILRLTGEIRRSIAYTTNARLLENRVDPEGEGFYRVKLQFTEPDACDGRCALLFNITPRLGYIRYIPPVEVTLLAAAQRWLEWFSAVPAVAEPFQNQYYFAWWVMRAGLISTRFYITREAMTPSKMHYVGIWQWDAYFHALAYRYVDMHLAHDQLRIQLDHQMPDGMIPDAIHDEGIVTHLNYPVDADVTKPPLIAWTAWKLHQHKPDLEFLNEIYEPIVRWNNWWFGKNDVDGNGLCEYQHPFSSGLDDSPLWDGGMPVEAPDLNTYLFLQQEALARIAAAIGEEAEAKVWSSRAEELANRLIKQCWDPVAGLFWPKRAGQPIAVRTPFSLFPLLTGRLPSEISSRLVAHLTDPAEFWARFPVPTVALNDPQYNPLQMWRGPTWVNVNYLLIEGLRRSGYPELARDLRGRTVEMMAKQEDIHEYYHPETGEIPPKAAPIFGWSAAVLIDLAIQATKEMEGG